MSLHECLDRLRERLLKLKPAGPDGFEGLVATALADITGLVFRLAKSGAQFGRDASSLPAPFAIAMEAKRYSVDVSLETLAGKATIARLARSDIDLWVVGATTEIGDDTATKLVELLEHDGVAPLILDWAAHPLPPLAVALAATRRRSTSWFHANAGAEAATAVTADLDVVAAEASFAAQADAMRSSCSAAEVGLDALRRQSSKWLRARFQDRSLSRQSFGQFLTVEDPARPAVRRQRAMESLAEAISTRARVVAVLGEEGTGKSWLLSQWWAELQDEPIPIFVSGRRTELLNVRDPTESLARLLAEQAGTRSYIAIRGWQQRIARWASHARDELRFVLVLDGINEHPLQPWSDIVKGHAQAVAELGGIVVVTSRTHFWKTEVQPRIGSDLSVKEMVVVGFTPNELSSALERVGASADELPYRLQEFLRNPRVCSVAMHLLPGLQPTELTVERLLLEYWRQRLEERGDLLRHNTSDFVSLLKKHAREWLAKPRRTFNIEDWQSRSGVVARYGPQCVVQDITEIQEGRFFTVSADQSAEYSFRAEALPFALGLLIVSDLRRYNHDQTTEAAEHLGEMLEPITGFDIVADVVAGAAGLAILDNACPLTTKAVLIRAWCELQNKKSDAAEMMAAYFPVQPDAFFAVAEAPTGSALSGYATMSELFLAMKRLPTAKRILDDRAARWLTSWSRDSFRAHQDADQQAIRQVQRSRTIDAQLNSLSEGDMSLFRRLTTETPRRAGINLDRMAVLLLAGNALSPHANSLIGWALKSVIAHDLFGAGDDLAWITRLNRVDPEETKLHVGQRIDALERSSNPSVRKAAAILLRLLGDAGSASRAEGIEPQEMGTHWRAVERFCDTNPHDPEAPICNNLDSAKTAIESLAPNAIWTAMALTDADWNLNSVLPALARFDIDRAVKVVRKVVETLPERRGITLRQLAWHLPSLSPVMDANNLEALRTALSDLLENPDKAPDKEFEWIVAQLVSALLPHLSAREQIDLLCALPPRVPLYTSLYRGMKPLSPSELEQRLTKAAELKSDHFLKWTLFFAYAPGHELTEAASRVIADAHRNRDADISKLSKGLSEQHTRAAAALEQLAPGVVNQNADQPALQVLDESQDRAVEIDSLIDHIDSLLDRALAETSLTRMSFSELTEHDIWPGSLALKRLIARSPHKVEGWVQRLMQIEGSWNELKAIDVGYAIASAYAEHNPAAAAALFARLKLFPPLVTTTLDGIPIYEVALFAAPGVRELDALRESAFTSVCDDEAIERLTFAAERHGSVPWLDDFVERLMASPVPGDIARGLTIAGLRAPNAQSILLLAVPYGSGFLGNISSLATKNYRRDGWARHWTTVAAEAPDGISFWRAGILAERVADVRTRSFNLQRDGPMVSRYGGELTERLGQAADKRSRKRRATLFGLRAPPEDLISLLRSE